MKSNNLQNQLNNFDDIQDENAVTVDYRFEDLLHIEQLEELQDAFTMLNNVYAVVIDHNGEPRTKVTGPSKGIGEFFDIVEIKEFIQTASDFMNNKSEYNIPHMRELEFKGVKVSGVPITIGNNVIGVWMICADTDYEVSDFVRVAKALMILVGNFSDFIYYSTSLVSDSGRFKSMHLESQKLLRDNKIYTDILELAYSNEDGVGTISQILGKVGTYLNISRVILAGFNIKTVEFRGICDWCAENFEEKRISVEKVSGEAIAYLYKRFKDEDIIVIDGINTPAELIKTFRLFSARGVVLNMIEITDKFAYMLIYIDEKEDRIWSLSDIDKTKSIKKIIEAILIKKTSLDGLMNDWKIFNTILDNVDSCIYVQSENGLNILYVNKKLKELFPEFKKNSACWEILHGIDKPCEGCYLRNDFKGTSKVWKEYNQFLKKMLTVNSVPVTWIDGSTVRIVTMSIEAD